MLIINFLLLSLTAAVCDCIRKLRDDPGGACYVTGQEFVRADFRGSDVTGEAVPLVDMGGLVQDQVSRCFVALDTDVESRPKMKNVGNN